PAQEGLPWADGSLILQLCRRVRLPLLDEHDLPGRVVAVLLGVEPAPVRAAKVGHFSAENAACARVPVGDVQPGYLVVAVVLAEAGECRIDGRRCIAALGEPGDRVGRRV